MYSTEMHARHPATARSSSTSAICEEQFDRPATSRSGFVIDAAPSVSRAQDHRQCLVDAPQLRRRSATHLAHPRRPFADRDHVAHGYARRMAEVASRELRNSTRSLLDRVDSGETLTITVDGRPVGILAPVGRRPRWVPRAEFASAVLGAQADAGLAGDLAELAGEMTDGLPLQ